MHFLDVEHDGSNVIFQVRIKSSGSRQWSKKECLIEGSASFEKVVGILEGEGG